MTSGAVHIRYLNELLHTIPEIIGRITQFQAFAVHLLDHQGKELSIADVAGSVLSSDRFAFDVVQHDRLIGVIFEHDRLVFGVRRDLRRHRHLAFAPAIAAEVKFN